MKNDKKEQLLTAALEVFAQKGYLGSSMSDIAEKLGVSKAALYKHVSGKEEILQGILAKMQQNDTENALAFAMPLEAGGFRRAVDLQAFGEYAKAQFRYWTEHPFASLFRKMLTLEQFRSKSMAQLYRDSLSVGPCTYVEEIFSASGQSKTRAHALAVAFYGGMFLYYAAYDAASEKDSVLRDFFTYTDRFLLQLTHGYDFEKE